MIDAKETMSKNGNPMIVVTMQINRFNAKPYIITDYMVGSYKKHIYSWLNATGKKHLIGKAWLTVDDFMNGTGLVEIGIQRWKGKERPKIIRYLTK